MLWKWEVQVQSSWYHMVPIASSGTSPEHRFRSTDLMSVVQKKNQERQVKVLLSSYPDYIKHWDILKWHLAGF